MKEIKERKCIQKEAPMHGFLYAICLMKMLIVMVCYGFDQEKKKKDH